MTVPKSSGVFVFDAAREPIEQLVEKTQGEVQRLRQLIGRPYVGAWVDEVLLEAAHQRARWGSEHDQGKTAEDWFWLLGYLAGKCLAACKAGDAQKARHHTVSAAAALVHWAAAISGAESVMRPGIGADRLMGLGGEADLDQAEYDRIHGGE